ncbi:hypothetical protein [Microcoleus sp. herbarium2]|uniref:hypothetical protein n=1 Tax=Microcoleus sp. herbarium2 TaxID=3055433 RepID=UPI002FD74A1A
MAAPIISDLLIRAVTRSTHKCSAGVSVVLPENICGFGPDVCAQVKGSLATGTVPAVQVGAGHAVSALSLHFWRFCKRVGASGPKE